MSNPALKYQLKRLSDYPEIPSTDFLIERYLPLGAQIVLASLPKKLKSFIALSWACCVATGLSWLGHATKKGRVLYIALESFHGTLRRQEAWRIHYGKSKADLDDLRFATVPVNFAEGGDILKVLADLAAQDFRPDLIVIDTWFKSTAGANVSDQAEMTKALAHLTDLQKKLQEARVQDNLPEVTVVIIAHTTKKGVDLFGSITQLANCDVLYMLNRDPGATEVTLSCTDTRDIEEPPDLVIGLDKVAIQTKRGKEQNLAVTRIVRSEELKKAVDEPVDKGEEHGRQLVDLVLTEFQPKGATWTQLKKKWQEKNKEAGDAASRSTFKRGFAWCKLKDWLKGDANGKKDADGKTRGQRYNLNPNGCWKDLGSGLRSKGPLHRSVDPIGPYEVRSMDPSWTQAGPLDPTAGCKNDDTTATIEIIGNSPPSQPGNIGGSELLKQAMSDPEMKQKPR
jgi:hypothetical protein